MSEKTEAQKRAQKKYMEKFCRVSVRFSKEEHEALRKAAGGKPINQYIKQAIEMRMKMED